MGTPLEVSPEHLSMTSAGLVAAQSSASAGVAAASATIVPVPAGSDDVSTTAAATFGGYAATFWQAVGLGLGKHQAGAEALVSVVANCQATDATIPTQDSTSV
jgi:hypothetical protein